MSSSGKGKIKDKLKVAGAAARVAAKLVTNQPDMHALEYLERQKIAETQNNIRKEEIAKKERDSKSSVEKSIFDF